MEEEKKDLRFEKRRQVIQIVFLIVIIIALSVMVSAIVTIHKYGKLLANPVGYNMKRFDLAYCTCYDSQYRIVPIKSELFNESFEQYVAKPKYEVSVPSIMFNFTNGTR